MTLDIDAEEDVDDDNTLQINCHEEDDLSIKISDVSGVERLLPTDIAGESYRTRNFDKSTSKRKATCHCSLIE